MDTSDFIAPINAADPESAHVSAHQPELGAQGPDIEACVREAIHSLHGPQFNAVKTGARSAAFWNAVEPAKRELLDQVRRDAGGTDDAPQTLLAVQEGFVEVSLFRRSMFVRLVEGDGPITTKGKTKALYRAYLDALDRETKLAQVLGLTRRARKVESVTDLLERA